MTKRTPRIRISRRHFMQGTSASALGLMGGCADDTSGSETVDPVEIPAPDEDASLGEDGEQRFQQSEDASSKPLGDADESQDALATDADTVDPSDTTNDTSDSPDVEEPSLEGDTKDTTEPEDTSSTPQDSSEEEDGIDTSEPEPEPILFNPGATVLDEALFPLGVQAGSATKDSIHLWTVLAGETQKRLVVFTDGNGTDPGEVVVDGPVEATENDTAHVDVTYLPSSSWFRYCFYEESEDENTSIRRSTIGRFRTAPQDDELEVIAFGGISCNNINYAPWEPLFHAAESALDFFLWAGDTVYADGNNSIEEFRSLWRSYLDDPSYRALMKSTSTLATWDDHEVTNNWDPETIGSGKITAATDAYFEHLPIRRNEDHPNRIWRSHRWGKTLEVFVLDCRSERKPSTQGDNESIYISKEQMEWLKGALNDSPCVFKFILNSVPITNMPFLFDLGSDDSWIGYDSQREEILSYISDNISGVIWLAGDFHMGAVTHVEGDDSPHYNQREILMGPGGQFANPGWFLLETSSQAAQYDFTTPNFNFVRIVADPITSPPTVYVEFVGADGDILYETALTL